MLKTSLLLGLALIGLDNAAVGQTQPNMILIMTDDQGIGDFGCTGNPLIETPNIDAMSRRSLRMERFYVSPVCAPTRACLLTGRYNYRTRVVDTFQGRAMMEPSEITVAEIMQEHGYATGIFGKWHLGDNFPLRPMDQGFQRSVVHRGGGIGQSSDPIEAAGKYTDPILIDDGFPRPFKGYCTNVYYRCASQFIRKCVQNQKPFFVYLPDNCPHGPFGDTPQGWMKYYKGINLENDQFPASQGEPLPKRTDTLKRRQIFSMISNIDQNIGKLYELLDQLGIRENTIVVFMTDNGPNGNRYRCSLRGRKTSVYEGGIRTLFLWDWPAIDPTARSSSAVAAHIDLAPTLLQACNIPIPKNLFDGRSFLPVLKNSTSKLPDRTLFIQTHRGNTPQKFHHFAAIGPRWKLVNHSGFNQETLQSPVNFELFDLHNDPYEMRNMVSQHTDIANQLRAEYEAWFADVGKTRIDNYQPPLIKIGALQEPSTLLSRQDLRQSSESDKPSKVPKGTWRVDNLSAKPFRVTIHLVNDAVGTEVALHAGNQVWIQKHTSDDRKVTYEEVQFPVGPLKIWATYSDNQTNNIAFQIAIETR